MKGPTISEMIQDLKEKSGEFLGYQMIVECATKEFQKLLTGKGVYRVLKIMVENYNDAYALRDQMQWAIQDYIAQSKKFTAKA